MQPHQQTTAIPALQLSDFSLDLLDPDLRKYVDWEGNYGPVFDHPLYRDPIMLMTAAIPADYPAGSASPAGLGRINQIVDLKQRSLEKYKLRQDWRSYVFTFHRPYRVDALLTVIRSVGASRLWPLIGDVWRDSESNMPSRVEWAEIWSHAYGKQGGFRPEFYRVMSAKERRFYRALPETITVYRGCFDASDTMAYSWTLDREMAEWFARRKRSQENPVVARMDVHKSNVLAYFAGRNESEVVIDFNFGGEDYEIEIIELPAENEAPVAA
ncbi:hypothetical protein [Rhizobium rhizogenes]|uniref:hypothetical protein n=1 Tax=Rhizobium rhizogenes TaxID=359 RepID=UPI0022BD7327|nr:hypothetical protein [Rhizobium rhizogenes]MCZ7488609.1 hypothetical protein [Rhizobium rhizogenes]